MSVEITDSEMVCDVTGISAKCTPEGWVVPWIPDRVFTRNAALTAMVLGEIYYRCPLNDRMWLHASSFEQEIGIGETYRPAWARKKVA
ncbi:hypothetical protein [Amycolatopsis minnesotensis]|uniref:DUF427 domain-containing protein n=1 Tax=Amycolatopsis minnesotensis TaxID=337894 RepID=A0ABN2RTY4_9PSEU